MDPTKVLQKNVVGITSRKWTMDFNHRLKPNQSYLQSYFRQKSVKSSGDFDYPHPVGYTERPIAVSVSRPSDPNLMVKKSWDIALDPLRQVPMNLFILWMAGDSISIFPIMMVMMMFLRPIQAIFSIQSTIKKIEGDQAPLQCLVYLCGNLVILALSLYKCHTMGLLPTYSSDWLAFIEISPRAEWSAGGSIL